MPDYTNATMKPHVASVLLRSANGTVKYAEARRILENELDFSPNDLVIDEARIPHWWHRVLSVVHGLRKDQVLEPPGGRRFTLTRPRGIAWAQQVAGDARGAADNGARQPLGRLAAEEAETEYQPSDVDSRELANRQIKVRRGQQQFRNALRERYGDRCLVTGCSILGLLEAAHIQPYRGESHNRADNGLLLRSDIHTLFDLALIRIDPKTLTISLHPSLKNTEYAHLAGQLLRCDGARPSQAALETRNEWAKSTDGADGN